MKYLQVTKLGIFDTRSKVAGWTDAEAKLVAWSQESEILLEPFDNFIPTTYPAEYALLDKLVRTSKNRINWSFKKSR